MKNKKNAKKKEQKYTSIQVTTEFKKKLKKVKDDNHFDSYENTIKYLIKKRCKK